MLDLDPADHELPARHEPVDVEPLPDATDESQAVESLGQMPRIVQGETANLKVTFAEDLPIAEMILGRQAGMPL